MAPFPRLYAIVDVDVAAAHGWEPEALAAALLEGGARCLQLRAKHLGSGLLLELAARCADRCRRAGALFILNDRADLAVSVGADGVHVGQDDLAPTDVRRIVGPGAHLGLSTHTSDQLAAALAEPVTYVAVGPVFGTRTKETGYGPVGLDLVAEARRRCGERLPVVAIGGITLETAPAVLRAGADAVAVISDLVAHGPPGGRVGVLLERLSRV